MAEAKSPSVGYLADESLESIEANRRYQEALAKLTESLDTRKNRFFDPVMLAAAQGFLAPTQTGGFGEALGNVAAKVGAAQELELKREQDIAQQRVGVAGQNVELQRMKARDAELSKYLGGSGQGPVAGPQAAPVAGPRAGPLSTSLPTTPDVPVGPVGPGALSQATPPPTTSSAVPVVGSPQGALTAMEASKPPGYEGVEGIQVAPANPNFMTGRDYVRLNRSDRTKSPGDLIKEGQKIEQERYRDKEGGVLDLATGKFYQFPTGKTEEIQLYGYPGTHKVDARTAAKLSMLAANDDPAYHDLAKRVVEGPRKRVVGEAKTDGPIEGLKSQQQLTTELEEAKTRAAKLGEAAAAKEAGVEDSDATARRLYGSTTRVGEYLKQSPNYFGIFARPGVTAAIGNLIKEGIQTPNGSLNLAGFEDSMRKLMPGVTQKDLDNATKAATELAEIELAFTRLYLAKQGAVTEGERKIVRAIPGTTSSSPEVLKTRMELLKSRAQFDIDVADAFRQWQDKNPGRSYLDFERKSEAYKDVKKSFEEQTEKIFGGIKAVPTRQRKDEDAFGFPKAATPATRPPAAAPVTPSSGFIRDPKTGVIRRKKEGE
jgi:hypothetical protein